jgi:tetratricopeptide (TPR) repeat protein
MPRKNLAVAFLLLLTALMYSTQTFTREPRKIIAEEVTPPSAASIDDDVVDAAQAANVVSDNSSEAEASSQKIAESNDWYEKAYDAYQNKKYVIALSHIEKAIALYSDYSAYYDLKAYIFVKMEDYKQCVDSVNAALKVTSNDPELYELKANCYSALKQNDKALDSYRKMFESINDFDGNPDARWYRNYLEILSEEHLADESNRVYLAYLKAVDDGVEIEDKEESASDLHFYASLGYKAKANSVAEMQALNKAIDASPDFSGYYNNRGGLFHNMKKYTEALADFNKGISLDKKSAMLYYNRSGTYSAIENHEKALQDLLQAKKLGMEDEKIYLSLGNAYKVLKKYEQALGAYQSVLTINPANKQVQNNMAILYKAMGKPELASAAYQQSASTDINVEVPLYNQAHDLMKTGKHKEAIILFEKALKAKPDFVEAYNQLGICYDELKQYDLALATYAKGLKVDASNGNIYFNRANTYKTLGSVELAQGDYLTALKLNPDKTMAYYSIAKMHAQQDNAKLASQYYQLATEAGVDKVEYFVDYSAFLLSENKPQDALDLALKGLKAYPSEYNLLINLASAYDETGDDKKNEATLKKAMAIDPSDESAYYNLGNYFFLKKKDLPMAEKNYLIAIDKNPELMLAYLNLASVYANMDKKDAVFATYKKLLGKNPISHEAYYNRGDYYNRLGMTKEAVADFDKSFALMDEALAKQKNNAYQINKLQSDNSLLKAQAYQTLRRFEQANTAFETYLNFNTSNAMAYNNYAYCLFETGDPKKAMLNFEKSRKLDSHEIDSVVGLMASSYLLNNKADVSKYKSIINRDFSGYRVDEKLLDTLSQEGYSYTDTFLRVWKDMMSR